MSSDYRPRGGNNSNNNSGGGGRRRRGGRGRGPQSNGPSYESRSGGASTSTAPKKTSFFGKLLGWFSGKKKSSDPLPSRSTSYSSSSRVDVKERDISAPAERTERPRREDRPKPAFVPQEITSAKLYVGNLSYDAVESDLFDLFSKVGAVKNVEVAMDRHNNRSKGFGFVEMESLETAKEAATKLDRTDFMGRQILVSGAKLDKRPSSSRDPEPQTDAEDNEGNSRESHI